MLIKAIREFYTDRQIEDYLKKAVDSLEFTLDTIPSYSYQTTYSKAKAINSDTVLNYSCQATVMLFDRKVDPWIV
jgi:hypothetical protein